MTLRSAHGCDAQAVLLLASANLRSPYPVSGRDRQHTELQPEDGDDDCDLQDGADDEPSLGSRDVREAGADSYFARAVCAAGGMMQDCEQDDRDREDDDLDEAKQQPAGFWE